MRVKFLRRSKVYVIVLIEHLNRQTYISFICIVCCFIMYYIYGIIELRIDFDVDIMSIFDREIVYFFREDIQKKNKFMFCKFVKNI